MSNLGYYFHIIFLLINIILMLNLVIAILSQSFQNLASYTNGLYCDTLVKSFAAAEWHDRYGCLACANTPLQVTYLLMVPAIMTAFTDEDVKWRNETLATMLYFPIALIITTLFSVFTVVYAPFAFLLHTVTLFSKMYGDKCLRNIMAFLTFVILGLPVMMITSLMDIPAFFENLYSQPVDDSMN